MFLASVFVVVFKIANPARFEVSVTVQGQVVVTEIPQVYGLLDIVTVAAFAIAAGVSGSYLVRSEREAGEGRVPLARPESPEGPPGPSPGTDASALVRRLLEGESRNVYLAILKHGGEILQRELVLETNLPKATVSRTLSALAAKGLITRAPHGLTNKIVAVRTLEELITL